MGLLTVRLECSLILAEDVYGVGWGPQRIWVKVRAVHTAYVRGRSERCI